MLYVPVYYLGHLIDVLQEHAFPIHEWLTEQGISKEKLYSYDTKIDPAQFDHLLKKVLSHHSREHLGLTVGRKLQIAHHGTFGLALLNCETIEQIIKFVQRYLVIRIPFIEISIVYYDNEVVVLAKDTHWQGKLHRFVIEAVTGAVLNIFAALLQSVPSLSISRLFFDYEKPNYSDKYNGLAVNKIEFNHGYCGIAIDKRSLQTKIPNVDKLSFIQAEKACEQELARWLKFASFTGKVQQCLMQYQSSRPNLEDIALRLNVSPRSLHRYLKAEQTSFKKILDIHQAAVAKECLLIYGYSVTQTAATLGYVDIANFRRAFKRWYNCTPSEFIFEDKHQGSYDK
ncbi:MAG: AraC-like DNA-binding protein [Patiriisocius sp.]|jgi:AraC-like DNA-binding protein